MQWNSKLFLRNHPGLLTILVPAVVFAIVAVPQFVRQDHSPRPKLSSNPHRTRVQRVWTGWWGSDQKLRSVGAPWRGAMITVLLRNSDRWFMDQVLSDPNRRRLDGMLTLDELQAFDAMNVSDQTRDEAQKKDKARYDLLDAKFQRWHRHCLGELQLMVAGQIFSSIKPFDSTLVITTADDDTWSQVVFRVEPGEAEKTRWQDLIRTFGTTCSVPISVALKVGDADRYMPTEVNSDGESPQEFKLALRPWLVRAAAWAALAFVIAVVLYIAATTTALRAAPDDMASPWSLARVTLAWWLTICAGCFLFLWAMTDDYNNLSGSAPVLLGINGVTLLFAASIGSRGPNAASAPAALVGGAPTAAPPAAPAVAPAGGAPAAASPVVPIAVVPAAPVVAVPAVTQGFFNDLVSEGGTPEVSRLQNLVWNGVLGIVFAWQTLNQWKMPEFNATLMTLLGISATTYVGFKFVPPTTR